MQRSLSDEHEYFFQFFRQLFPFDRQPCRVIRNWPLSNYAKLLRKILLPTHRHFRVTLSAMEPNPTPNMVYYAFDCREKKPREAAMMVQIKTWNHGLMMLTNYTSARTSTSTGWEAVVVASWLTCAGCGVAYCHCFLVHENVLLLLCMRRRRRPWQRRTIGFPALLFRLRETGSLRPVVKSCWRRGRG